MVYLAHEAKQVPVDNNIVLHRPRVLPAQCCQTEGSTKVKAEAVMEVRVTGVFGVREVRCGRVAPLGVHVCR